MLENKLNKLKNATTKHELITGLKECGFSVFSDPDTEHGWFDDGLNDTVVKIIPHSCTIIPLDWYVEGEGRKDILAERVINNIFEHIEYSFKELLRKKLFIKKMYKIIFNEEYKIDISKSLTLEDKLNYLNEGIETVDNAFIDKLSSAGIDNLEYDADTEFCKYYTPEERKNGKTSCFDGYVIYYVNPNTGRNTTVYECMKELARLYGVKEYDEN